MFYNMFYIDKYQRKANTILTKYHQSTNRLSPEYQQQCSSAGPVSGAARRAGQGAASRACQGAAAADTRLVLG